MLTLQDSPAQAAFRAEVREWAAGVPDHLRGSTDHADRLEADRLLSRARLLGISWPVAYGGRGASAALEAVLTEELGIAGINRALAPSHQGINNLGPTLIVHGSETQKERHLPAILGARELWCQGFSEPDAGSDLASVRTTAVRDGDEFRIRGSKIWTSGAQDADWIYVLARTAGIEDRHKGLSFFLVPMQSPGITLRPIRQITGDSTFCEVFFDEVVVPEANVVGDLGDGWRVTNTLLTSERLSGRYRYSAFQAEAVRLAAQLGAGPIDDRFLAEFGRIIAQVEGIHALSLRADSMQEAGVEQAGLSSINKLWWPATHQRLTEFALQACTALGLDPSYWYKAWLASRAESIYGGSAQIQRNILAERHLGMPRPHR